MSVPDWQRAESYVMDCLASNLDARLTYHGIHHTRDDVLPAARRLGLMAGLDEESMLLLLTGALYHDIGYVHQYHDNEALAAQIAVETLPTFGYAPQQIRVIENIILATRLPQQPRSYLEMLMCDADLDSLGRDDYFVVSFRLWYELAAYGDLTSEEEWLERQVDFLSSHSYFTAEAIALRQAGKQNNLACLYKRLDPDTKDPSVWLA